MADQPISQEIRLPTNVEEVTKATARLDDLIARVERMEHAESHHHESSKKHQHETESGFKGLWDTMGKVVKREAELAVGIHAIGAAGLEAHGRLMEFFEFIGAEAALELLKKIGEEIFDIGKEAFKSAAMAERMNFALDAASGGAEGGERVRKWVEANAKFSEFSEAQNESAYLGLRRKGVGQDKAGLYMKAAEDIAAVSAPEERTSVYQQTLEALARVHSQGRISARGAMQLGITVDDLKSQPGFKGLSNQKVWQKAEKSNLDENTIMALIMRHTGEKAIGEKAADASGLLLTRWSKLTELPELFYKRLGESATTKKLTQEIDVILEKLDPDSPTGKRIFGALESSFTSMANAIGEIDFESLADTITNDVLPALTKMVALVGPALKVVEKTLTGLHVLWRAASDPLGAAGDVVAGKGIRKSALEQLSDKGTLPSQVHQPTLLEDLSGATLVNKYLGGNYLMNTVLNPDWWHTSGEAAGEGYAQGIGEAAGKATEAAAGMGESSHAALMSSIDAHSPSRKFAKSGGDAGEGYAIGIERSGSRVEDAMDSTFSIPAGDYGGAGMSMSLGGSLGGGGISIPITINVTGGDGAAAIAGAVEDVVHRSLVPAFIDAIERARLTRGD